ncbi:MAG: family 31 glucosidase [Clostridia bacterium]|nr:family 31 glucosidase [Clostridia bacterium]
MFEIQDGRLVYGFERERLWVEPWGENSVRVRGAKDGVLRENEVGALDKAKPVTAEIRITEDGAVLKNGRIEVRFRGPEMTFYNDRGEELTGEHWQGISLQKPEPIHDPLLYPARVWRRLPGGGWRLQYRMKAYEGEKLFGMGQYDDGILDRKGSSLELRQRNKQASVPFVISSRGYGMLWNNPAVGRATFAENGTIWEADSTDTLDYWITAGDAPSDILHAYFDAAGHAPMMSEAAMGFWQCKLRYATQDELMEVAREYHARGIPLKVIVIDFYHWTAHGDWKFDPACWPDPEGMCRELREMGIELAVSIWPTVERKSENYKEMREKGLLMESDAGVPCCILFDESLTAIDVTNPETRIFVWDRVKKNYLDKGVKLFWLDCAEPEVSIPEDMFLYSYAAGPVEKIGNIYPRDYAKLFYEGQKACGVENPVSLVRCAWAGSQKYGALVWSGDIFTTWKAFREQIATSQSMAMAGIPWWTSDIGGFIDGDRDDEGFRELLLRWFEWATYCPVMRMHGARAGKREEGKDPPNEIWSYGEEAYGIMKAHIEKREAMRPYIRKTMREAEAGDPPVRPLFYSFPDDPKAWETPFEHMFGSDLLIVPVLEPGARSVTAYLPAGCRWEDTRDGAVYKGGSTVELAAPLESIPVLKKI